MAATATGPIKNVFLETAAWNTHINRKQVLFVSWKNKKTVINFCPQSANCAF